MSRMHPAGFVLTHKLDITDMQSSHSSQWVIREKSSNEKHGFSGSLIAFQL